MSKDRENKFLNKMEEYDKKAWTNKNMKIKQKEKALETELQSYFKPNLNKSSKQLALKKKNNLTQRIATGGKSQGRSDNIEQNSKDNIFDRLYNEAEVRKSKK